METDILKLIRVLEAMLERYKSLLKLCYEQKQALIDNDIIKLKKIVEKMNRIADDLVTMETERQAEIKSLEKNFSVVGQSPAASDICSVIQEPQIRERYQRTCDDLKTVIGEIQKVTVTTERLTQKSLDYTNRVVGMFSSLIKSNQYGTATKALTGGNFINVRT